MKFLIIALSFAGILAAQNHYVATATTTALTIQQPATNARDISFPANGVAGAWVSCAAAQTVTLSWSGTAATSTAGTALMFPPSTTPASMTVWTASNVGSGTTGPTYPVAAGGAQLIDLSFFHMGASGTGNNLTISSTGSCIISIQWTER